MTKYTVGNPTWSLFNAISREKNIQKCAIVIIDEDENDKAISAEIEFVKYCVNTYTISCYLFYMRDLMKTKNSSPYSKSNQVSDYFFKAENEQSYKLTKKWLINKSLLEAAGKNAQVLTKDRNSCFGDYAKKGGNEPTLEQARQSNFHSVLGSDGIQSLILTGRARASCIKATAIDALKLNYRVFSASSIIFGKAAEDESWIDNSKVEFYTKQG